jgi:hypothetical protein
MDDPRLADRFAEGTAPERDPTFAEGVATRIGRVRLAARLALVARASVVLALIAAVYVAGRAVAPAVARIAELSPEFMGVPVPLVLGALIIGLLRRVKPYLRLRVS